jgi:hypothetical protein
VEVGASFQSILVIDNGPAMRSRPFRNFVNNTELLVHVCSRQDHPQTGVALSWSVKLEHLYRVLPNNCTELFEAVSSYRLFYL